MTPTQQLDLILRAMTPEMRDAFLAAIQNVVDNVTLQEITLAIAENNIERVVALLNMTEPAFRPLVKSLESTFEQIGDWKAGTFPARLKNTFGSFVFRFDMRNPRAEKWLREKSSELIAQIMDDTRANVRNTVTAGLEKGRNPRSVALDIVGRIDPQTGQRIGGIVGLTKNQESWVRSARRKLENLDADYFNMELRDKRFDATVQKAISDGKPLTSDVVDKLIDRYKANALKHRGETIARTETIQSLNQAEYEATKQAVESGAVDASAVQREWDSAGDNRVRPAHRAMDGQRVGLDEAFTAPDGSKLMFPGDTSLGAPSNETVGCRCRVRTVVDWLAGVK